MRKGREGGRRRGRERGRDGRTNSGGRALRGASNSVVNRGQLRGKGGERPDRRKREEEKEGETEGGGGRTAERRRQGVTGHFQISCGLWAVAADHCTDETQTPELHLATCHRRSKQCRCPTRITSRPLPHSEAFHRIWIKHEVELVDGTIVVLVRMRLPWEVRREQHLPALAGFRSCPCRP